MPMLRLSAVAVLIFTTPAFCQPEKSAYLPKNLYLVGAKTVEVGTREVLEAEAEWRPRAMPFGGGFGQ